MTRTKRQKVKGRHGETVDAHERGRDYLGPDEIDRLLDAAKKGRHNERDYALLLLMYRHGLRVSEVTSMRLADLKLKTSRLWVERLKGSLSTEHPVEGDELRAIKRYLATRADSLPWLFVSEQGTQPTRQAVNYLIRQAGERAGLGALHPHMLRHSCGYALANAGRDMRTIQDYLGHRSASHGPLYANSVASVRRVVEVAATESKSQLGILIGEAHQ